MTPTIEDKEMEVKNKKVSKKNSLLTLSTITPLKNEEDEQGSKNNPPRLSQEKIEIIEDEEELEQIQKKDKIDVTMEIEKNTEATNENMEIEKNENKKREEMEVERDNFDDENVDFREKIKRLNLQYNKEVEELKGQLGEQVSETKYLRERNAELISSETSLKTSLEGKEAAMKEAFLKNETLKENLKTKKVQIEKEKNILTDKLEKLQSELSSLKSSETRKEGDLVNELKIREIVITKLKEDLGQSYLSEFNRYLSTAFS